MGVYQPLLCGINLLLLCSSTALIYLGSILINFYLLPSLFLFSSNFSTVPHLIITLGVFLFFFSIVGFVAAAAKSRPGLIVYAVLTGLVFVLQLTSIFTALDLRNELELEKVLSFNHPEVDDDMANYWRDEEVRDRWDSIQRDFQCCGSGTSQGWHIGYRTWERASRGASLGVPVSCCLREEACNVRSGEIFQDLQPEREINTHGCMTVMERRLVRDVMPLLLTYIGCSVLLALLQILTLVLAAAYSAAISRKARRGREGERCQPPLLPPGPKYSDTLYSGAADSGTASRTGSIRSNHSTRLELAPPRTPGSTLRSSLYIEPSSEAGTVI